GRANGGREAAGVAPPGAGSRPGDVASPESAAQSMRRAGFHDVTAYSAEVAHPWDAAGYLAFLTQFDEESLFAELESDERRDIEGETFDALSRLSPNELTLHLPVIYALGRASS